MWNIPYPSVTSGYLCSFLFEAILESQSISLVWVFLQVFVSFGKCLFHTHPGCLPFLFLPGHLFRGCCLRGGNWAFGCSVGTCVSLAGGAQRWLWHLLYLARMLFVCFLVFCHLLSSTQTVPNRPPVSTWVFLCHRSPCTLC